VIFKWKEGFATNSLGIIYHSIALSQPPSRDTVPLNATVFAIRCYVRNSSFGLARFAATEFCLFDDLGYGCIEAQPQTAAEQYWNKGVLGLKEDGLKV
jgi:hypothetical protein